MKCLRISAVLAVILGLTAPAWAQNHNGSFSPGVIQNSATATGGAGGQGGTGGNASATGGTHIQTNTQVNTQGQSQNQGQQQGQLQGQGQGQSQSADNKGNNQSVEIKAPSGLPMNTGVAVAPGLTSVGHYGCLGSWSLALGGPGAAIGGGSTKRDKGCEHARDAVILMGWGYAHAALSLIGMNEDTAKALANDPKAREFMKTAATVDTTIPDLKLNTPLGEEKKSEEGPTNFGERTSMTIPEALVANLDAQSAGAGL